MNIRSNSVFCCMAEKNPYQVLLVQVFIGILILWLIKIESYKSKISNFLIGKRT